MIVSDKFALKLYFISKVSDIWASSAGIACSSGEYGVELADLVKFISNSQLAFLINTLTFNMHASQFKTRNVSLERSGRGQIVSQSQALWTYN